MRAIHWVDLDNRRPAVVLTRHAALRALHRVTIAPITSTVRGLAIEVAVGVEHGLDHDSVINCDNITTVHRSRLGAHIGYLGYHEEVALLRAVQAAFDLLPPGRPPSP